MANVANRVSMRYRGAEARRSAMLDLISHFYRRQIISFEAGSIRRNPEAGREFQEHGGVAARGDKPLRRRASRSIPSELSSASTMARR